MRYKARKQPILLAIRPLIKAPISAPTGIRPPRVEASREFIGEDNGDSEDFKTAKYGEVQAMEAPTPRVNIFTVEDNTNYLLLG